MKTEPDHTAFSCITKREYFAALAMQGILANERLGENTYENTYEDIAEMSVRHAEALIVELNKP